MNQKRQEKLKKNPVFFIKKKVQRGEGNLIKEGNARCVFVPQKLTKLSYGAFPSFPERLMKMIPLFQKQVQVRIQSQNLDTPKRIQE